MNNLIAGSRPVYFREDFFEVDKSDKAKNKGNVKGGRRKQLKTEDTSSDEESNDVSLDVSSEEGPSRPSRNSKTPIRLKRRRLGHLAFVLEDDLDELEERNDEGSSLGEFVANNLKLLTSDSNRVKLKRSILQLLISASEEDSLQQS